MKRVLYFTGYRMVAQEWFGRKLVSNVYFEPDEQGLDLFSAYLRSFRNEPVRLLVDLIEEEFRQLKVPLLRGADRQAILQRNFAKFFRTSEFRHAVSQSVEKKGRKEEKLLLLGLTNQSLLEPWLKILGDTRTPLSGIISLPLLSESFAAEFKSESKAIILVSQEVPSNLRQSVFIDGKLILSRLVPIASFYHGDYASDMVRDIESTQRYLISQRIVERSDKISVHVLCNARHRDKLTIKFAENTVFDFHMHEINEVLKEWKIELADEQDFSSALFCYMATKKVALNHYARGTQKKYYNHHLVSQVLKVATIGIMAGGIGLASASLVRGLLYDETAMDAQLIEQKYSAKFNQLSQTKTDSATSTAGMRDIVQTVEDIGKRYLQDPEEMMAVISRDVSLFPDLRVKQMDWFLSDFSDTQNADAVNWNNKNARSSSRRRTDDRNSQKRVKGFFEIARVKAELINFDGNYRYALSVVDDLEKTMRESGNYFYVEITKRPLDIESDNRLSGDASGKSLQSDETALVEFRLVRKVDSSE
jgi:hypothetical protein